MRLISALSFKTLLTSLAVVPLLAAVGLGAIMSSDALENYRKMSNAVTLDRLARAGGSLLLTMPVEGAATLANRTEKRQATDAAYQEAIDAYDAVVAAGYNDPIMNGFKTRLVDYYGKIGEFRAAVDADKVDPIMPLKYLQPISAMGMEMTGRAAGLVDDRGLSQAIQGYFSLLEVNDSYLIMNRIGQVYNKVGALNANEAARFHAGYNQSLIYAKPMREFLPKALMDQYDGFWQTGEGAAIQKKIEAMANNQTYTPAAGDLDAWNAAMVKRRDFVAGLAKATAEDLGALAARELAEAQNSLVLMLTLLGVLVTVTMVFSVSVLRTLSGAIHRISARMHALAEGDKSSVIPYLDRRDEIGGIAQSVEFFRQAALRNDELELAAEENRKLAERDRIETQRRIEAEAEERLTRATGALASGLQKLAAGDLLCEIAEEFAPQFEALRHDFNTSVSQLRATLVAVGGSASVVSGGSSEISHASDNLAKRTEQQAASLEETAAALEQITANVTATSKRTGEARDLVRDTRSRAEHSGVVVNNAVSAMERIEHSSRQIGQIIGVIDEIAFQTNLLALNAGVEAARAGDAGKGFAVVAQEVRELAQRSANAAKEIKSLISNSEVAVSEGVKLVNDTGEGLTAIAGLVQSINAHMDAIATAAQEQSVGLGEVNTAVNHMDHATQQNAAMVEEMNAAGAGLAQESGKLADLLGQFRTGDDRQRQTQTRQQAYAPAARAPAAPVRSAARPAASSRQTYATQGNAALKGESWEEF
ncbi:methyl-accepting chemotaxis protein [Rhizobium sp. CG5]|uniref:methyl-accepting chemotaxis protein n=1 Tax=Rhizobium sp. CG5 TaxID=2726076 RepID=UPI0020336C5E|nr:HAMP domain-containing methyl-accepting chemotaxis protein [Rhizobium sp. CG5]MCM2471969.1 methyl-accepting chemotaxis protein [Rhizobium sp. CG5]